MTVIALPRILYRQQIPIPVWLCPVLPMSLHTHSVTQYFLEQSRAGLLSAKNFVFFTPKSLHKK